MIDIERQKMKEIKEQLILIC